MHFVFFGGLLLSFVWISFRDVRHAGIVGSNYFGPVLYGSSSSLSRNLGYLSPCSHLSFFWAPCSGSQSSLFQSVRRVVTSHFSGGHVKLLHEYMDFGVALHIGEKTCYRAPLLLAPLPSILPHPQQAYCQVILLCRRSFPSIAR